MGRDLDTTPLGFLRIPVAIELARLRSFGESAAFFPPEESDRKDALQLAISATEVRQQLPPSLAKPPSARLNLSELDLFRCLPERIRATLGHPAEIDRQAWQDELAQLRRRQADLGKQMHAVGLEINEHLKSGRLGAMCWRHDNGDISQLLPTTFWHSDAAPAAFRGERWFVPLAGIPGPLGHEATAILRRSDVEACYAGEGAGAHPDRRREGEKKKDFLLRRIGDTEAKRSAAEFRALARGWLEPGASEDDIKREGRRLESSWRVLRRT